MPTDDNPVLKIFRAKKRALWKRKDARARKKITEAISELNESAILFDGFEQAFIGVAHRCGQRPLVTYSYRKCIEILMDRDDMDREQAIEYFEFNTMNTWVGVDTPIIVQDMP